MTLPTPILVVHALGDPDGGSPWRAALEDAGWDGPIVAPDLPGHGSAPARVGGSYEYADALLTIIPTYASLDPDLPAPIVVGVGLHGWAAQLLALGGRASGLVLVDGLNGPWRTPAEQIASGVEWVTRIAADPAATAPAPPPNGLDPRAAHGVPTHGSKRLALKAARVMPVPALILESPRSPLTRDEADEVAREFATGATVQGIASPAAADAVDAIVGRRLALTA